MEYLLKLFFRLRLLATLFLVSVFLVRCQGNNAQLTMDGTSKTNVEEVLPDTPAGNLVRQHLRLSMGNGEDAEVKYQQSLTDLRAEPEAVSILSAAYKKVPEENYLYRNMLVEALKQLHSGEALASLNSIASERIPEDRNPENEEMDTRIDETVIRLTAVEGISLLATDSLVDADKALRLLIGNKNLSIRQMAVRGYLQSAIGDNEEKIQELYNLIPKEEHWYITNEATNIKEVAHPDMPENFEIKTRETDTSPKIKE